MDENSDTCLWGSNLDFVILTFQSQLLHLQDGLVQKIYWLSFSISA
jgi:hypothetical protein